MKNLLLAFRRITLLLAIAVLASGCATSGNSRDPLEGFNRGMYSFNEGVDKAVLKPVATAYSTVVPDPIQTGVTNFFANIADVMIAFNNLLQGKFDQALTDITRVLVNTTVGLLGVMDVASNAGLEKHDEDFGQTFGRWGISSGAYVVLPIFGPSSARDAVGTIFDAKLDPLLYVSNVPTRNVAYALRLVNGRARLLDLDNVLENAALDKYSYVRNAYLQRRLYLVYDGKVPPGKLDRDDPAPAKTSEIDPALTGNPVSVEAPTSVNDIVANKSIADAASTQVAQAGK